MIEVWVNKEKQYFLKFINLHYTHNMGPIQYQSVNPAEPSSPMPPALTSSSSSSDSLELTSSPSSKMMCCTYANERMTFCWIVPGPKVGESYGILHKCSMVTFLFTLSLNSLTSPGQSLKTVVGLPRLAGSPKHGAIQILGFLECLEILLNDWLKHS